MTQEQRHCTRCRHCNDPLLWNNASKAWVTRNGTVCKVGFVHTPIFGGYMIKEARDAKTSHK